MLKNVKRMRNAKSMRHKIVLFKNVNIVCSAKSMRHKIVLLKNVKKMCSAKSMRHKIFLSRETHNLYKMQCKKSLVAKATTNTIIAITW